MTNTPETEQWEAYCDECYYHMWRLRRKNERGWHDGFHIHTGDEARGLCDLLNNLERERDEVRELMKRQAEIIAEMMTPAEQRVCELEMDLSIERAAFKNERDDLKSELEHELAEAREALIAGGLLDIIDRAAHERAHAILERDEAIDQRDILADEIERLQNACNKWSESETLHPLMHCQKCGELRGMDHPCDSLPNASAEAQQ